MGSTHSSGNITVVDKFTTNNYTYRKDSRKIKSTTSDDDTVATVVTDAVTRPLGSGSVVIDGTATHYASVVVGMTLPGRCVNERIASTIDASRSLSVDLAGNTTKAVIPSGLEPEVPNSWAFNAGSKVVRQNSVDDSLTDRT